MDFIDQLALRQGERTLAEYSSKLGIAESTLSRLLNRERVPGRSVASRILEVYPDLIGEYLNFLRSDLVNRQVSIPSDQQSVTTATV